ncbi:Embryo defective 1703, putative isoform 2 [Cucumis melo var. makuwa]|uniref:Embryo defective 1703, putative isoform 2 n=1 Tax=Cucumis melo var. makuwa TaxID=1194695 RepID=A0A5A7U3L8_CUCMM|nr:Embryo defective 1703, putative isoform 2 [Cucumis melo var. makuwa]TYK20837.1 Embryo defective 1703, putative isoform 2 [Cucumis melo var. makuwa]
MDWRLLITSSFRVRRRLPDGRSNSLRKKLTQEQQVRRIHIPSNPNSDFQLPERTSEHSESSGGVGIDVSDTSVETRPKGLGESVLWNRLENWVDQYKKDIEFWGIGSGPIFTVFQDSNGNVKSVSINEDEILKRCQVERMDLDDPKGVNYKISTAKTIAREIENGKDVLPRNSSVAKFVIQGDDESSFLKAAQGFSFRPEVLSKFSGVGGLILCSFLLLFSLKKLFAFRKEEVEYTELEKEMMRRKIKSRKEKEVLDNGRVEIIQVRAEPPKVSVEKPRLDKQELMRTIAKEKSKVPITKLVLGESTGNLNSSVADLSNKIQEIRDMARDVREMEAKEDPLSFSDENNLSSVNGSLPNEDEIIEPMDEGSCFLSDNSRHNKHVLEDVESGLLHNVASVETKDLQVSSNSNMEVPHGGNSTTWDVKDCKTSLGIMDTTESDTSCKTNKLETDSEQKKLKIIRSVKEAREYLSERHQKQKPDEKIHGRTTQEFSAAPRLPNDNVLETETNKKADSENIAFKSSFSFGASDSSPLVSGNVDSALGDKNSISVNDDCSKSSAEGYSVGGSVNLHKSLNSDSNDSDTDTMPHGETKNWIEDNFDELEPFIRKIGVGFRDNYMAAREKAARLSDANSTLAQLQYENDNDEELEWMKDENLRDIVFKVRENELANRDPFYSMDPEDKVKFFNGLEKKIERQNEKLLKVHEWLHSNIENLDYGADGISIYDPPEKIIPRWKGPLFEKSPEFFNDYLEQRKAIFDRKAGLPLSMNIDEQSSSNPNGSVENIDDPNMAIHNQERKKSMTIIESSDGSTRPGKKSGKEFWQHTKKWSRGFLESYNAETDPEVKSVMKDIGKDLDRWITEKEVQEAADLMDKLPEKNKKFVEKKLNKLKREMEMFGPQAVVSKYREYAEDEEEDYLWWLDLRHVLCIELYTMEDEKQRIGFYSLEMAADLELEPKPCHVIAFENASDCKNFCYIIQSHMEMLGTGIAFVVALPPKDAFREAKANGFGVTVIRKGELQLNVDQTLEEVEEQITEIGSKMYQDKIMKDRSVDISSLMKGVFGLTPRSVDDILQPNGLTHISEAAVVVSFAA